MDEVTHPPTRTTALADARLIASPLPTVGVGLGAAALIATAGADDGLVLCPFRRCTGGYCPGCGATRAANRLVRGDVAASWSHHPWVVLLAVQVAVLGGWFALRGRDPRDASPGLVTGLGIANAIALLGIWVVRLEAGTIPTGWL